jgi:hypothetical protein
MESTTESMVTPSAAPRRAWKFLPNIPRLSPTSPIYISTNLWVANFNPFTPALMGDINGGQLTGISPDNVSIEQREKVLGTDPITVTEVEIVSLRLTSLGAGSPNHFGMSLCKVSATPTGGDLVKCVDLSWSVSLWRCQTILDLTQ